ncbi:hypothetical protein M405DRAFT_823172, partial [Rhizopogon salebrosus TDB-379]
MPERGTRATTWVSKKGRIIFQSQSVTLPCSNLILPPVELLRVLAAYVFAVQREFRVQRGHASRRHKSHVRSSSTISGYSHRAYRYHSCSRQRNGDMRFL